MLSQKLKETIESYNSHMQSEHVLFEKTRAGALGAGHLGRYLASILYLIQHTPLHLELAREESRRLGLKELEGHFAHKLSEEEGHDKWAESDIDGIKKLFGVDTAFSATPAMRELVAFIEETIRRDPALYLSYILFAEYFTVLIGPPWIKLLEEKCSIPPRLMSVVGNHSELDKEHVLEGLGEIDRLVGAAQAPGMHAVLQESMQRFARFCDDIATLPA